MLSHAREIEEKDIWMDIDTEIKRVRLREERLKEIL